MARRKGSGYKAIELGMRVVLYVADVLRRRPDMECGDLAQQLRDRFDVSRASSYRYVALAKDALGVTIAARKNYSPRAKFLVVEELKAMGKATVYQLAERLQCNKATVRERLWDAEKRRQVKICGRIYVRHGCPRYLWSVAA